MKSLLKLTLAITAATLGSASLYAGGQFRVPTSNDVAPPRLLMPSVAHMKCDTMVINGGIRKGPEVVSCKHYSSIRPDDCRRACANK